MSEAALWGYLRDRILPRDGHYSRIESETSPGFPDVHYTLRGTSGTLELKFARHPLPFGKDGLRKDQIIWINEEREADGNVLIVAEVTPEIFWVDGIWARDFNSWSLSHLRSHSKVILTKGQYQDFRRLGLYDLLVKKT